MSKIPYCMQIFCKQPCKFSDSVLNDLANHVSTEKNKTIDSLTETTEEDDILNALNLIIGNLIYFTDRLRESFHDLSVKLH